jgi:Tol biopolymer transport system component
MDADGSHVRGLVDSRQKEAIDGHVYNLAWSPDGSRLAFDTDDGIWVVGFDGSGLRMVIRHGANPNWSPDARASHTAPGATPDGNGSGLPMPTEATFRRSPTSAGSLTPEGLVLAPGRGTR